jgi:hypothetical protein
LAVFQEQFAVVGAIETAGNDFGELIPVKPGLVDQRGRGRGHASLQGHFSYGSA